ncbi:MAG: inner membrane protein [Yoonia sp.]
MVINVLVLIIPTFTEALKKRIALGVFSFGVVLGIYQIKTRGFDFDYQGFAPDYKTSEAKSKEIQREILGDTVFGWMEKLDQNIPFNF